MTTDNDTKRGSPNVGYWCLAVASGMLGMWLRAILFRNPEWGGGETELVVSMGSLWFVAFFVPMVVFGRVVLWISQRYQPLLRLGVWIGYRVMAPEYAGAFVWSAYSWWIDRTPSAWGYLWYDLCFALGLLIGFSGKSDVQ